MKKRSIIILSVLLVIAIPLIYIFGIQRHIALSKINKTYADLPVIRIDTENKKTIKSKDIYVNSLISVENCTIEEFNFANYFAEIRGRGNATWSRPKKPYRLKFDEEVSLFGLPEASNWTLLADYIDPTLSRNHIALTTARDIFETFQSNSVKVEVYLNGKYNGVYTLCDQIEVGETRIDIEEKSDDIDTGYLLEMDARAPQEGVLNRDYFELSERFYAIKSPETDKNYYSINQLAYIKQYLTNFEAVIKTQDYANYIDVDSFVDYYLVSEIFDSLDIADIGIYIYKEKGGKLFMGPLWDFDNGDCAIDSSYKPNPEKIDRLWTFKQNQWASDLLENEDFVAKLKNRWNELYDNKIAAILPRIIAQKDAIKEGHRRNKIKWQKGIKVYDYSKNRTIKNASIDQAFDSYYTYMTGHIEYLNNFIIEL